MLVICPVYLLEKVEKKSLLIRKWPMTSLALQGALLFLVKRGERKHLYVHCEKHDHIICDSSENLCTSTNCGCIVLDGESLNLVLPLLHGKQLIFSDRNSAWDC